MRSALGLFTLFAVLCSFMVAVASSLPNTDTATKMLFRPKYFRYRRWDPTHDFYDDYEFAREVRRPFSPMAYRQRISS